MIVYHGTNAEFDRFSNDFMDSNDLSQQLGSGFYFSKDENNVRQYGDIVLVCEIPDGDYFCRYESDEVDRNMIVEMMRTAPDLDGVLENYGEVAFEGYDAIFNRAVETYIGLRYDQLVLDFANDFYSDNVVLFNEKIKRLTGYVGVNDTLNYCVFLAEDIRILS